MAQIVEGRCLTPCMTYIARHFVLVTFVLVGIAGGVWCQANQPDRVRVRVGRILGTAVEPDGTPPVAVEIEPVDSWNPATVALVSKADGSFATERLPAGRYRVGVDLGINRQPDEAYGRSYYPGTSDVSKAIEIEISKDMPEPRIVFTVPNMRPLVKMQGKVAYEDGSPAYMVDVLFSPVGGYSTGQLWTEADGHFASTRYGSVAYRVRARSTPLTKISGSSSRDGEFESEELIVQPADLGKPILLVLHPKSAQEQ